MQVGQLFANLGLNMASFNAGMGQAKQAMTQATGNMKGMSQSFQQGGQSAGQMGSQVNLSMGSVKNITKGVTDQLKSMVLQVVGLYALVNAVKGAAKAGIEWNAQLETSQAKWTTLLGSTKAANEQLLWMQKFAAETPFEFAQLESASSKLKAYGFSIEQTRSLLQTLGDASAATGMGAEGIERMALALGQMQAKGKVTGEEMKQLAETGIPVWQMLADSMGKSVAETMKLSEKGLIPASKAIPTLAAGMDKVFGGAMEKQAATFTGRISTLKDNAKMLLGDIMKPGFEWLRTVALPGVIALVDKFSAGFKSGGFAGGLKAIIPPEMKPLIDQLLLAFKNLGSWLASTWTAVAPAAKAVANGLFIVLTAGLGWINKNGPTVEAYLAAILAGFIAFKAVQAVLKAVEIAQWALNLAMNANPIGIVIVIIGLLVAAGVMLMQNWDKVKYVSLQVWGKIKAFILDVVGKIIGVYADFIGVFSKDQADAARQVIANLRNMAEDERAIVEDRKDQYIEAEKAKALAEEAKAASSEAAAGQTTQAWQDAGAAEKDVWASTAKAAEDSTGKKVEYLQQFDDAWGRAQDDQLSLFERSQTAQNDTFDRGQQDRMTRYEANLQSQSDAYNQSLQDQMTDFERSLDDEKVAFERAQQDKKIVFEAALDDEKEAFKRSQEDQLDAFKQRQSDEMDTLKARHDQERSLQDAEYAAKLDALKGQQDGLDQQKTDEEWAQRQIDMTEAVAKAQADLADAQRKGDPVKIADAQKKLNKVLDDQAKTMRDHERKLKRDALQDQIDALRREQDAKKQSLQAQQKDEEEALRKTQQDRLTEYQRELEDLKLQEEAKWSAKKLSFERQQADDKKAQEQKWEDRKKEKARELEDLKKDFEAKQAERKTQFKRQQEDEKTAWMQMQEDRKVRFKRELEDLKASLKEKLDAQRTYLADLAKLNADMASKAPAAPSQPSGGEGSDGSLGNNGVGSDADKQANDDKLKSDAEYVQKEIRRTQDVIAARKAAGLDTSAQEAYLDKLNGMGGGGTSSKPKPRMFANGGIATKATPGIFGEKGPEAILPLSKLKDFMPRMTQPVVPRSAGSMATVIFEMDGRELTRRVLRIMPSELNRIGVRMT